MIKIGILGSCVSQDSFRTFYNKNYKKLYKIQFMTPRLSVISIMNPPIEYNYEDIIVLPKNPINRNRMVFMENDLSKTFFKKMDMGIDYLIIDEYFEVKFGVVKYNNSYFTHNYWDYPYSNFFKKINNPEILNIQYNPEEYFELWKNKIDEFFNTIEKKYPNVKIVLNKSKVLDLVLNKEGEKFIYDHYTDFVNKINPKLEKIENYIEENYKNVIIIDLRNEMKYCDENHIWGLGPVHYNKEYYTKFFEEFMKIIVKNNISETFSDENECMIYEIFSNKFIKETNDVVTKLYLEKESLDEEKKIEENEKKINSLNTQLINLTNNKMIISNNNYDKKIMINNIIFEIPKKFSIENKIDRSALIKLKNFIIEINCFNPNNHGDITEDINSFITSYPELSVEISDLITNNIPITKTNAVNPSGYYDCRYWLNINNNTFNIKSSDSKLEDLVINMIRSAKILKK